MFTHDYSRVYFHTDTHVCMYVNASCIAMFRPGDSQSSRTSGLMGAQLRVRLKQPTANWDSLNTGGPLRQAPQLQGDP